MNAMSAIEPFTVILFRFWQINSGRKKLVEVSLILEIIGKLLPLLGTKNIALLAVGNALGTIRYMPIFVLTINILIECMDYGEWKFRKRGEGIYSCISEFCSKIGTGLGNWLVGFVMMLGGYVSNAASQI